MPYVFDHFRLVGNATNLDDVLALSAPTLVDPVPNPSRRGEYLLQSTVLRFPLRLK